MKLGNYNVVKLDTKLQTKARCKNRRDRCGKILQQRVFDFP